MTEVKTKRCSRCHQDLSLTNFCSNKARPDGLNNLCRACARKYLYSWRLTPEGKESRRKSNMKYNKTLKSKKAAGRLHLVGIIEEIVFKL